MEQKRKIRRPAKKVNTTNKFLLIFFLKFLFSIVVVSAIWLFFAKQYVNFKVEIVKLTAKLFYSGRAPYIHEVPFYQGLATPLIPFIALILATLTKENFKIFFNQKRILKITASTIILFLIEIFGHFLEIVSIKGTGAISYFLVTILFSVGVVLFPFLSYLFVMDGWPSGLRRGT